MIVYRGFQGLLVRLMSMHTAATSLLEFIVVQVTGQIIGSVIYIHPQQKHAGFLRCVLFLYKLKIAATVKLSIGQGFIAGRYYLLKGFFHMMVYTHFVQLAHFVILNDFPFIITTTTTIQPFFQASWGRLEMKPKRNKGHGSGTLIASFQALLSKAIPLEIFQSLRSLFTDSSQVSLGPPLPLFTLSTRSRTQLHTGASGGLHWTCPNHLN